MEKRPVDPATNTMAPRSKHTYLVYSFCIILLFMIGGISVWRSVAQEYGTLITVLFGFAFVRCIFVLGHVVGCYWEGMWGAGKHDRA